MRWIIFDHLAIETRDIQAKWFCDKKVRIFYASEDLYGLKNSLENQDVKSFEKFKKQHEGNVQLSIVYSKDNQYFAAQVLKYEPFEYKPQSDILIAEGETAARFIANIKN